jgi:hypothetical protein
MIVNRSGRAPGSAVAGEVLGCILGAKAETTSMRSQLLAAIAGMALFAGGASAALAQDTEKLSQPPAEAAAPPPATAPKDAAGPKDGAGPEGPPRFSFNRVDGGFLRLDSVSGQVAMCSQRTAGWACQAVPDDRAALDGEIARLQERVTALQAEVAALRAPPAPPRPPAELAPRAEGDSKSALKLPTDEDLQWARAAIEKVWRQFVDMVAEFQKDLRRKG